MAVLATVAVFVLLIGISLMIYGALARELTRARRLRKPTRRVFRQSGWRME